ncbi:hypothetical protein FRB99_001618 [Tulasnella sp. 403]|nr:hypothetical protein FRB99_001618 [Tulasnella sp. 403]
MATFASKDYNAASYATFRFTYPQPLLDLVLRYHSDGSTSTTSRGVALDLGCGTGQVVKMLIGSFDQVIGTDASTKMIEQARADAEGWPGISKVEWIVSPAEDVAAHIGAASVDLVTAGQAAHWFDQERVWEALAKVTKPGATVAFWGYSVFHVVGHPELASIHRAFEENEDCLGPFWEQPGINILSSYFRDIPFPDAPEWDATFRRRVYFFGETDTTAKFQDRPPYYPLPQEGESLPPVGEYVTDVLLRKYITWEALEAYIRTWSAVLRYQTKYPEDKERRGRGEEGDIVDRWFAALKKGAPECKEGVDIEVPLFMMVVKRASN